MMGMRLLGLLAVAALAVGLLAMPVITVGEDAEQKSSLDVLLKQRRDTLQQIVEVMTEEHQIGNKSFASVVQAKNRLIDAELELAKTRQDRLALLQKQVKMFEAFSVVLDERFAIGAVQQTDLLDARVAVLDAKIDLAREQNESNKSGTGQKRGD